MEQILKSKGYRVTHGRLTLLKLLKDTEAPLSVRDILKRTKGDLLDQVTIYRALESFSNTGLVLRGLGPDGTVRFSYPASHHHHLMCVECGFIKECINC